MTIKDVNKQLRPVQSWEIQPGGSLHISRQELQVNPGAVLEKVCGIYNRVRPILIFGGGFWLVPKKWRESIKQFTALMDTLCPQP